MNDPLIRQIFLQVVLILLNAVFACAEIAVISFNDNKLAKMAEQKDKRAVRLARLTSQPARFLATIQVAITLSGFLASAFAADSFSGRLVNWLVRLGVTVPAEKLNTVAVVFITVVLSYFTLVLGELVPKRLAMKNAESLALGMSGLVSLISSLFAPVVWLLTASTNGVLRLFGVDPNAEDEEVTEEEIRMMVDAGSQKGVINSVEQEMIKKVFEFDDLTVGEFATHRTDISLLWMDETVDQWDQTIHESRHSLYPVCDETVDNVVGVLNAKDYFRLSEKTKELILEKAVKSVYFVPESLKADLLFRQMKQSRNYFAVVLDEYGGMNGIVTMNDLIEQIVGELEDDTGEEEGSEPEIERIDSTTWKIKGSAFLKDVGDQLSVVLPTEEYDTFGGFVFGELGSIPDDGTTFEIDAASLHIKVTEIREHRIEKAFVCLDLKEESEKEA